ncbi:hypothetical protein LWE61_09670 [Sphingobium sufflavum]|jgi:hypothetical protein|uniref:hypothetical protein n=1 Tax=Sphingobium sufflavum TaxID=1129547 RepID=UPI001F1B052D|nr:hypothetical protein [Sphingobium sufflavum]MCE7796825.1 hypothetical protein [Sphingobium sufflavum]
MAGHWTKRDEITGVRAKRAVAFGDTLAQIVNGETEEGWDALLPMIDTERFVRRGNERDREMDWPTYRAMLDQWNGHSTVYEKHLFRATEAGPVVYLDLDERSVASDGQESTLRSVSIYEFDEADRIISVDVCMGFHQPQ